MAFYSQVAYSLLGLFLLYFITSTFFATLFPLPPQLRNKNIVLLIGHPDDEAMFFAPSVLALTAPQNRNHVKIVCLSTGNAVGLGEIRRGELLNSARRLGLRRDQDVYIADDPRFQDGPDTDWKGEDIAEFLSQRFAQQATSTKPESTSEPPSLPFSSSHSASTAPPRSVPDVILTFDPKGISLHPNHCACHTGAAHYIRHHFPSNALSNKPRPPTLYTLTTIRLLRKYLSFLDAPLTAVFSQLQPSTNLPFPEGKTAHTHRHGSEDRKADSVVIVSGFQDYMRAFGAMVYAHKTQMLWFRWGWILAGRYMIVNDLRREELS